MKNSNINLNKIEQKNSVNFFIENEGNLKSSEMEFKEFEPRFKSAKTRFKFSAGLNLDTFDTILSGTNHI